MYVLPERVNDQLFQPYQFRMNGHECAVVMIFMMKIKLIFLFNKAFSLIFSHSTE